jgi:hypothetical protein
MYKQLCEKQCLPECQGIGEVEAEEHGPFAKAILHTISDASLLCTEQVLGVPLNLPGLSTQ